MFLYILSAILDKVDGVVARSTGSSTELGRFFDGTVDKISSLTIMAVFTFLTNEIHIWFFILVISRDLTVEGLRQYIAVKGVFPKGQMSGKIKVFLQMVLMGTSF
jgi:CDP-diacylglycerol---glycerol-3-phosphate 3-phosphatidyltransferase